MTIRRRDNLSCGGEGADISQTPRDEKVGVRGCRMTKGQLTQWLDILWQNEYVKKMAVEQNVLRRNVFDHGLLEN